MDELVPTYGLLAINHAYSQGKITFKKWLELSRTWAEGMIEQQRDMADCRAPLSLKRSELPVTPD